MPKYKLKEVVSNLEPVNQGTSDLLKYEEYYDEYEPGDLCTACHGTGLDEDEFEDCPVCWGEGYTRQGGLTGWHGSGRV